MTLLRYPEVLTDIGGITDLDSQQQRELARLLIESRIVFDQFQQEDRAVSPGVLTGTIKNLLGSFDLLSSFARKANVGEGASLPCGRNCDPASLAAMKKILEIADELDGEYQSVDRAARATVLTFFSSIEQVYRIADRAERAAKHDVLEKEPLRAIAWLCGERLPDVYSQIFRKDFKTTRENNPGIKFVQDSLRAIGVRAAIENETIVSHRKAALRVKAAEKF